MMAGRSHVLADFPVIGAVKAGPTSLWSGLRDTPRVFVPITKRCVLIADVDAHDVTSSLVFISMKPLDERHDETIRP